MKPLILVKLKKTFTSLCILVKILVYFMFISNYDITFGKTLNYKIF